MKPILSLVCVFSALSLPFQAQAYWHPMDSGLGFWGHSMTVYRGDLIVGGYFAEAGDRQARAIATWDGTAWTPLGRGMPLGFPAALTVYDDKLIAGGTFSRADTVRANYIAQWDGAEWTPLGSGIRGSAGRSSVIALTVYDGRLIAGGVFYEAGGVPVANIAQWDGSSWSPLGLGIDGCISALTVYNGNLIAAGTFAFAGGRPAANIAQWDGSSWSRLGSGISDTAPGVWALAEYDGRLIAAGAFSQAGSRPARNIAQWDGASWSPLGEGVAGARAMEGIGALEIYDGKLIAAGLFNRAGTVAASNIAQWDGTAWSALSSDVNSGVLALGVYNGGLIAGGAFDQAGSGPVRYIARWDSIPADTTTPGPVQPGPVPGKDELAERYGYDPVIVLVASAGPGVPSTIPSLIRPVLSTNGTKISFALDSALSASLDLYNVAGVRVRTIFHEVRGPGRYELIWDGRDDRGANQPSGIYFCRLSTRGTALTNKVWLVR